MSLRCGRCGTEAADGARFCSACGAVLDAPAARERKLATIVFADLVGSTELVDGRDPEDVRRLLGPFFELARRTFEEYGGRVEKFIGDAAVAVFGVPQAHGDDPDRAVAASLRLLERMPDLSQDLRLRIGIEAGEVLVDSAGADLAVTGDSTHAAARLQQAAGPDEVLVGERAAAGSRRALLGDAFDVAGKGFGERLVARRAMAVHGSKDGARTPLLGRGAELERLRLAYLRAVRERQPSLALIVGEAGFGKTRLAGELVAAVEGLSPAPEVVVGRNPPYGDGIAFWALGEILRELARVGPDAGRAEIHDGLEARLTRADPERRAESAATLVATATGEGDPARASSSALRLAWRRLLASVASESPLVVAVDDAHWADEEFLGLIEDSVTHLTDLPILVICTARPSLLSTRPEFAKSGIRVELGPLGEDAAVELAATLLAGAEPGLAREVARTSGGNPFFTEEIARAVESPSSGTARLPDTVQTAIASRLDALPSAAKGVLQRAAVLGDRFRLGALEPLVNGDPRDALATLCAQSLIRDRSAEEDGLYSFHHQLIRDVAYESLPRADRTRLHEQAAAGITDAAVEHHPELAEVIAFHLVQAADLQPDENRARAAYEANREAGALAFRRGALARAHELLEQAAKFAPDTGQAVAALREAAEIALRRVRGDIAYRLLREAGNRAELAGDAALAAATFGHAIEIPSRMGGISGGFPESELQGLLDHCHELAPDPEPATKAQLRLDDAWIAWRFDREYEMDAPANEGLELARAAGDTRLLSSALDAVSATRWREGRFRENADYNRERLRALTDVEITGFLAFERQDAYYMLTQALVRAGELRAALANEAEIAPELALTAPAIAYAKALLPLMLLGEWDEALESGLDVRQRWIEDGRPPFAAFSGEIASIGAIHGFRGDELAAEEWFQLAESMAAGNRQMTGIKQFRADVTLYGGDAEAAMRMVDGTDPGFWWTDFVLVKRAEAHVRAGSDGAAEAIEVAASRDSDDPYCRGVLERCRGLLRDDEAELRKAVATFERFGYAFEAARTRVDAGGEEANAGLRTLEELGAIRPAS